MSKIAENVLKIIGDPTITIGTFRHEILEALVQLDERQDQLEERLDTVARTAKLGFGPIG